MGSQLPFSYQSDVFLKNFSSFGIGGQAKFFTQVTTVNQLQNIIRYCYQKGLSYFLLGKGSNCLFNDRGFDGLVIQNRIDFLQSNNDALFHAGAGYSFSRLGSQSARMGFSGLEFASGIPCSVGGAIYMNAGANGSEAADCLKEVVFILENGDLQRLLKKDIDFEYRKSSFQKKKGAIVEAVFELSISNNAKEKQKKIIDYRLKTQPYKEKSAGCVFKNLECGSAGEIIDRHGLKGSYIGDAMVSLMHANFIVNKGEAKASDVLALISLVKEKVFEKSGLLLEEEIKVIPYKID